MLTIFPGGLTVVLRLCLQGGREAGGGGGARGEAGARRPGVGHRVPGVSGRVSGGAGAGHTDAQTDWQCEGGQQR